MMMKFFKKVLALIRLRLRKIDNCQNLLFI